MNKTLKWILIAAGGLVVIFIIVPLILGILTGVNLNKSIEMAKKQEVQTYFNPQKEIKFQYPGTWNVDKKIVDGSKPMIAKIDRSENTYLALLHELNNKNYDLEECGKGLMDGFEFAPGFSLVNAQNITINGIAAYEVIANFEGGVKARVICFVTPDGGARLFTIGYYSTQDEFDKYLIEFDGILQTVETK